MKVEGGESGGVEDRGWGAIDFSLATERGRLSPVSCPAAASHGESGAS